MNALLLHPAAPAPELVGTLAVRRFGAGAPLVLVHGGVGSWTHWIANVEALSRSFAVTAVDLPGYGDAPAPQASAPEAYLDAIAADLSRAMADAPSFGLVGFSFGAVIAAAVARRLGGKVNALSLLGPGGFGVPLGRKVALVPVPAAEEDLKGHRVAVAHNLGQFMMSRPPAPEDPVVDLQSANIARLRFDSRKVSHRDCLVDDVGRLTAPLQIIWGAEDHLPVPSIAARAERVSAARPDAEIHIVPDAGHWVQYEAPRAVEALLSDFHNRVSR
ncbi:alpha/beta fold hydrolase [Xanthobacter autotrophicus DSM 431]|uniref:alpha/beta fold hydrolase n=1 Tax=Xanthobacter nonsaccharivorans TaxID=3119912 RepID=UPI003728ABB4